MPNYKITIEIRKPSYAQNKTVRNSIPRSLWNAVRDHVQQKSDFTCEICGVHEETNLEAHEIWGYDEERFLLILEDVQALCKLCHDMKHIHHVVHRTKDRKKREFVMNRLKNHFVKVNGCTEKDFLQHYHNQVAKSDPTPVNRSLEDMIEIRERKEREAFLNRQEWKFVIGEGVPFSEEIESALEKKGLLWG
ncbi:hypothetical protein EQV77_13125 [Halobacillus fulvus]|nr:hypothetical protein EQV77_13125 [Halobacillus fulvus]